MIPRTEEFGSCSVVGAQREMTETPPILQPTPATPFGAPLLYSKES